MPYGNLISRNDVPASTDESLSNIPRKEDAMAEPEQVKITNGGRTLTVSRKAFNTIYGAKGYSVVGETASASATDESPVGEQETVAPPAKTAKPAAKKKTPAKKSSKTAAADANEKAADS